MLAAAHLYNADNGLYYLSIDLDWNPYADITSDLVFPVMFGVADDRKAATVIGLPCGVWVGVSFWYAFAAAKHSPALMAHALSSSFRNYSIDPRRNNTVPGQFSEWLNGETLVNEGMMLSPWFPPRYVWAAIEGVAGFESSQDAISVSPRLAPEWKWLAVQNLPYRGRRLTWFAARMPDIRIYTNFVSSADISPYVTYEEDISAGVQVTNDDVCVVGFRQARNLLLFAGNTAENMITASIRVIDNLAGSYRLRRYDSLVEEWTEHDSLEQSLGATPPRSPPCSLRSSRFSALKEEWT